MKFKFEDADDIFSTAISLLRYALMANFHENPRPFTYSNNVESAINEYIDNIQNEIYSDSMLYDYIKDNIENNNDEESEYNEKESDNNEKESDDNEKESQECEESHDNEKESEDN